jgi:hypothetical protein
MTQPIAYCSDCDRQRDPFFHMRAERLDGAANWGSQRPMRRAWAR